MRAKDLIELVESWVLTPRRQKLIDMTYLTGPLGSEVKGVEGDDWREFEYMEPDFPDEPAPEVDEDPDQYDDCV
jgi:hypothetical protein